MLVVPVCAAAAPLAMAVERLIVRRTGDGGWSDVVRTLSVIRACPESFLCI